MPRIALICDSTADIDQADARALDVEVVPLNVHFGSEVLRDYVDISPTEYLKRLQAASELPRTSQPSPALFTAACERALESHDAVLILTLSAKVSGTHQSAALGASTSGRPDAIRVFDTRSSTVGMNMQVRRARALIDKGLEIDAIMGMLESEWSRYHLIFLADTLDYLQRGGRIGRASHLLGSLLKIKPLLRVEDGEIVAHERTRSRARAIEGLIDYSRRHASFESMSILHDGTEDEEVEQLKLAMTALIPREKMIAVQYGPTIATHAGPRALGICVFEGGATTGS